MQTKMFSKTMWIGAMGVFIMGAAPAFNCSGVTITDDDAQFFGVAVDEFGNQIVVGEFVDELEFGHITLDGVPESEKRLFVAKFGPTGRVRWASSATHAPGTRSAIVNVATDVRRNIYVSGRVNGEVTLGDTVVSSPDSDTAFLSKLDPRGNYQWTITAPGSFASFFYRVDKHGNTYAHLDNTTILTDTTGEVFPVTRDRTLVKLDTHGAVLWTHDIPLPATFFGGLDIDREAGDVYMAGVFLTIPPFQSLILGDTELLPEGNFFLQSEMFIAKLNSDGVYQWATAAGGIDDSTDAKRIAFDGDRALYITANFGNPNVSGPGAKFGDTIHMPSGRGDDMVIAKMDSHTGAFLWSIAAPGAGDTGRQHSGVRVRADAHSGVCILNELEKEMELGETTIAPADDTGLYLAHIATDAAFGTVRTALSGDGSVVLRSSMAVGPLGGSHVVGVVSAFGSNDPDDASATFGDIETPLPPPSEFGGNGFVWRTPCE